MNKKYYVIYASGLIEAVGETDNTLLRQVEIGVISILIDAFDDLAYIRTRDGSFQWTDIPLNGMGDDKVLNETKGTLKKK